jgi:hypothetical protein
MKRWSDEHNGCSFLLRAAAIFSSLSSLTLALCSLLESRENLCSASTWPFRFLAICFRVFWKVDGIVMQCWETLCGRSGFMLPVKGCKNFAL